jgi:hypothetical protein
MERRRTSSHFLENSLWKCLLTCHKTDNRMNVHFILTVLHSYIYVVVNSGYPIWLFDIDFLDNGSLTKDFRSK